VKEGARSLRVSPARARISLQKVGKTDQSVKKYKFVEKAVTGGGKKGEKVEKCMGRVREKTPRGGKDLHVLVLGKGSYDRGGDIDE